MEINRRKYLFVPNKPKIKTGKRNYLSSPTFTKNNIEKEPLKNSSNELSFKGSSIRLLSGFNDCVTDYKIILKNVKNATGFDAENLLKSVQKNTKNKIKIEGNKIQFEERGIINQILDYGLYPIIEMPFDIINYTLNILNKGVNKCGWEENIFKKLLNTSILKKFSQKTQNEIDFNALKGILEKIDKDTDQNDIFRISQKIFDPKKGKYNGVYERSLNRIVTGGVSTYFLANDAYNLASLCTNDPQEADEEKKIRANQEIARIGVTAYLQLITLGALTRLVNGTTWAQHLISGGTVLLSEWTSRSINGKPVFFLTKDKAKEYNIKNGNKVETKNNVQEVNNAKDINNIKDSESKGLFTLETLYKYLGISILAGVGFKSLSKVGKVQEIFYKLAKNMYKTLENRTDKFATNLKTSLNKLITNAKENNVTKIDPINFYSEIYNNGYKELTQKKLKVSKLDFDSTIQKLNKNGFSTLSNKYKAIADNNTKNNIVILGSVNKKIEKPVLDFIIGIPKFAISVFMFPYKIFKSLIGLVTSNTNVKNTQIGNSIRNLFDIKDNIKADKKKIDDVILATNTYLDLSNKTKYKDEDFKQYVNNCIKKSFNNETISNNANNDMAFISKMVCSSVTSLFLIADNYNMVMIKSDGEDKEGAWQKAKERTIQRVSSLLYSGLFMNLFNTTFVSQYNKSLIGMSLISGTSQTCMEITSRASIGMPILGKSKEEIENIERKHEEAKGLQGDYFRFMSKVIGKKKLSDINMINKASNLEPDKEDIENKNKVAL